MSGPRNHQKAPYTSPPEQQLARLGALPLDEQAEPGADDHREQHVHGEPEHHGVGADDGGDRGQKADLRHDQAEHQPAGDA
ncbi:hypothetical protein [Nonomuraea salmonea]|uniref:hypothetical protein n=1 Tax=Nonomuraea salmonea TaxID=46181 RepID=UPI0031F0795D